MINDHRDSDDQKFTVLLKNADNALGKSRDLILHDDLIFIFVNNF